MCVNQVMRLRQWTQTMAQTSPFQGVVIRVLPSKPLFGIINTVVKCEQSKARLSFEAISPKN